MSNFAACYRSADPEVMAAWKAYSDDVVQFFAVVVALTAELWPKPVNGHQPEPMVASRSWTPGKRTLGGWSWPYGVKPPEGWKVTTDCNVGRVISPKRSANPGKALAKYIEAAVPPVRGLALPGMPLHILALPASHSPAVEQHGDALFVGWTIDPEAIDPRSTPGGKPVDREKWERIKVSEFFAAREDDPAYAEANA
ncbi:MAG: hypothetical protein LC798_16965 [Chloroflexi bacterium]|nr:hypothetical protein [Chloroflexota bacterium]